MTRPEVPRAEVWVDAAAAREGVGTRESPLRSLDEALARPGPLTVYLAAGEYRGPIEVSGDIRLEGQGDATVLDGGGQDGEGVRVAGEGGVVLRNLSVRGGAWGVEVSGGGRVRVERVGFVGQHQGAVRVTSGRFEATQAHFETSGETVGVLLEGAVEVGAVRTRQMALDAGGARQTTVDATRAEPHQTVVDEARAGPQQSAVDAGGARQTTVDADAARAEPLQTVVDAARAGPQQTAVDAARAKPHQTVVDAARAGPQQTAVDAARAEPHQTVVDAARAEPHQTVVDAARAEPHRTVVDAARAGPQQTAVDAGGARERTQQVAVNEGGVRTGAQQPAVYAGGAGAGTRPPAVALWPRNARLLPPTNAVVGGSVPRGVALRTVSTRGPTEGVAPRQDAGMGAAKPSGSPRQEAWLSGATFTGPFRRAVRVRGAEARATLEDVRFLGAVTAVGMDGGHAEIRHAVAEGSRGAAFSVVEGVLVLEDVRARGHEVSVSAMRVSRLEVRGFLSVGATRAGLSVGASTGVLLEDVVVRDSGSHGAFHFTGSEVRARRLRVDGAAEYGVVAVGGSLALRGITVARVRSNDGITGEGLHLRQVRAEVEGAVVRETSGACVFAAQNARVVLRDAELDRCGQSALSVETRASLDATGVESRAAQESVLAAMEGGELRVDALIARGARRGLVSAECTEDTRVKLGRVRTDDDRGVDAPCVERFATEAVPGPR
ncbi:hypothetical protein [Myxococcus landrumensis]|uniref:Lipoprotein n=1 Tax=Myxococcus landrumensis TaxID=2813577 RepID=A0ABX7NK97_9BACT|nr:hypothetical protein [Myxococcus landrumus]QSQ17995.1 hypothetical protein JY572_19080 [Myxococcus landrumus]